MASRASVDSYLASWLRRTRRQLAPSGRLSEVALILSQRHGHSPSFWTAWLRRVLEGEIRPSLDELTAVDGILATPRQETPVQVQATLF